MAIDLGVKRIGVAVCDELRISVTPLDMIERRSWKDLLRRVSALVETYDAKGLVIGLLIIVAWGVPVVAVVLGGVGIAVMLRRWSRTPRLPASDEDEAVVTRAREKLA